MPALSAKQLKRVRQLFAMMGSKAAGESEAAKTKLNEYLEKLKLTWNDLPGLLASSDDSTVNGNVDNGDDDKPAERSTGAPNALELIDFMLRQFVDLKPAEYVAVALWIAHTFVFDQFLTTPRLALLSPVRGCGKTTLLAVIERLSARALRTDGITAAALYQLVHRERRTLLVDEADNVGLTHNGPLRAALNSGHRKGGCITRLIGGEPKQFAAFSPAAIAAIGALPLPIMARSVVIRMQRAGGAGKLRRLDDIHATADLDLAYRHIFMWAREAKLDPDPKMPTKLSNRAADNWRALISIADSFGPPWGTAAREAAIALLDWHSDEDIGVMLLSDIRGIFDGLHIDRIPSAELVQHLVELEEAGWSEFRGLHDDQSPRRLSQSQLATLLKPFGIRPRTIWPLRRRNGSGSHKGYMRAQFQSAWDRYCPEDDTSAQANTVRYLRR